MTRKADKEPNLEEEVWSAISAFEQILEAMPEDQASLEALSHAYEQIGDHVKAKEYLIRLGNVFLAEDNHVAAQELTERLQKFATDDQEAKKLLDRIRQESLDQSSSQSVEKESNGKPGKDEKTPSKKVEASRTTNVRSTFNMADELSFAWNLMEANELNQEEYASVVQDLTELSAGEISVPVSVLHVLEHRSFPGLERIIGRVAKQCGTPIISIASFEMLEECAKALPIDFIIQRGALVFDMICNHALVVVMNPYDAQLRKDVETATGRSCHFYMTVPQEFDRGVEKIKNILAGK
ncbi:MAG: hypothetical protein JXN60_03245 [Lentisphaerae bacterium]|nr:hypothetical protein [Lentisphaerota bacterium]